MSKLVEVYEVYEENTQRCVCFKSLELAESQRVFSSVDTICKSPVTVLLTGEEIKDLEKGLPLW